MTASVQERGKYYHITVRYKDEYGNWKTKSVSTGLRVDGNNKRKAEQKRLEILKSWEEKDFGQEDILVTDYFKQWLESIKSEVQPNTFRGYRGNMEKHIIPYFAKKKLFLSELKARHLEEYYKEMLKIGLSPQTIKHHHQNISNALNSAVKKELIASNVASLAKSPKTTKYKGSFLNSEQLKKLYNMLDNTVIKIPVIIGAYFGLRRSEILGLKWKYVDFELKRITIAETVLQDTGGNYTKKSTKNESSYRTLPMSNYICELLKSHKAYQESQKAVMRSRYHNSDYVCTWPDGRLITPNYLTSAFHDLIASSDLPYVRLHDLRHSVASNLLANGYSVVEVQEWLGHSSPSTTLNFYSHIDSSKSKLQISKTLDGFLQ